ncbi:M10 family metallopeptidase [Microvirga lotononidis]|uniref:Putative calcium-binding protein n=1 Tax=Microvirga lotononidis TaxID=864069 RepID=I4YRE0_9HYPH|nr:M10 family metallopeptidase [Microvirga lotononidis]EIM26532.1 putative calcium-binding protein [Microvirga lotononidis]WQO31216.1 M10 family metallopeptidase [Microvirga lotononidis]
MATPKRNTVPATFYGDAFPAIGKAKTLLNGVKWGGDVGKGVTLTWSVARPEVSKYVYTKRAVETYNETEVAGIKNALKQWSDVSGLKFSQVTETSSKVGELRFVKSPDISGGYGYYPSSNPSGGDVWISSTSDVSAAAGIHGAKLIMHEIGHALGLKHPTDKGGGGKSGLQHDSLLYTVMAYNAVGTGESNRPDFYPTTPMYNDLLAIQALYGRNAKHNAGNTTYVFEEGQKYWQTIDDAGGNDTIKYVGTVGVTIDLREGKFSSLSAPIEWAMGQYLTATVSIGPKTVIEKAIGGDGNDVLIGNSAKNTLYGGLGDDTLNGGAGDDKLYGGWGSDVLTGGAGKDAFVFDTDPTNGDIDRITDFNVKDDTIWLSRTVFTALTKKGDLAKSFFKVGSAAADGNDFIIYDKKTGLVSYDPDGSGPGEAFAFAQLKKGLALTHKDFLVI